MSGAQKEVVTVERAREALEDMDDYARMDAGVDAKGPREALERFIADHEHVVAKLRAENRRRLDDYDAMEALALEHKARASIAEARVAELERFHDVVQTAMQIHVIDEDAINWIEQQLAAMQGGRRIGHE